MNNLVFFSVIQEASRPGLGTVTAILNIWFVCWAIRRRGELDIPLDATARVFRWSLAISLLSFPFLFPSLVDVPAFRVCVGFTGLAFLCWPNLAFRLTKFLRRLRILRPEAAIESSSPDTTEK
jgi:hypothetical protein